MANATTPPTTPKVDQSPFVALRQRLDELIDACEIACNGGHNSAFDLGELQDLDELTLSMWVTADLWRSSLDCHLDQLDVVAATATPTTTGAAQDAPPEPAPIVRDAAELPPAKGTPYWLS